MYNILHIERYNYMPIILPAIQDNYEQKPAILGSNVQPCKIFHNRDFPIFKWHIFTFNNTPQDQAPNAYQRKSGNNWIESYLAY